MGMTAEDMELWKAAERERILKEVDSLIGVYDESPVFEPVDIISEVRRMNRENLFYLRIFTPKRVAR